MGDKLFQAVVRTQRPAQNNISTEHVVADTKRESIYEDDANAILQRLNCICVK